VQPPHVVTIEQSTRLTLAGIGGPPEHSKHHYLVLDTAAWERTSKGVRVGKASQAGVQRHQGQEGRGGGGAEHKDQRLEGGHGNKAKQKTVSRVRGQRQRTLPPSPLSCCVQNFLEVSLVIITVSQWIDR
jgi:hypothetical protein